MKLLALDLATHTGYAFESDAGILHFGTWDFSPKRSDSSGMRFVRFESELNCLWEVYPFTQVYFEEVGFAKTTQAAQVWGGFAAVLMAWCEKRKVRYQGVPVSTLKKHATGKGNADKAKMVAAAEAQGWKVGDDNQADACWLLDFGKRELNMRKAQ